ncbi:MAG: ABC transporter ATP-binding protein [Actinomycetota bacterium]|nr:ABC transporter ATP-binding protein [Actinomycetota bacterium]
MTAITLEALEKRFGGTAGSALDGIDLEIADGEFVVLLGPSGCGKSTTLRLIAGLETPTGGTIRFGKSVVNGVEGRDRNIGMVFQNYALYPHMTVTDNLCFGLKSRGVEKGEILKRLDEILEMLSLGDLAKRRPRELSGGQRQRVALGRALIGRPSVFLMDEPLSNLDANLREQMRMEIAKLHRILRITTVYVTHDQVEALTLADRIVVMNEGKIQQVSSPRRLYDEPANIFVARFIGAPGMNVLRIEKDMLIDPDSPFYLDEQITQSIVESTGSAVRLGIRPEDLALHNGGFPLRIRCRVVLIEQLGTHLQVHLEVDSDKLSSNIIAKLDVNCGVAVGDVVTLGSPAHLIHRFDDETELHLGRLANKSERIVSLHSTSGDNSHGVRIGEQQ